jgi:pullulanase/glycogen debranching enzyme
LHRLPSTFAIALAATFPCHAQAADAHTLASCNAAHHSLLQASAPIDARALTLDAAAIRWPGAPADGRYRLYYAEQGTVEARPGAEVRGADGFVALTAESGVRQVESRFSYAGPGIGLTLARPLDATLLRQQLVVVREDAQGIVLDATGLQLAGALDDRFAKAEQAKALGVALDRQSASFHLWAPTSRQVSLCIYDDGRKPAIRMLPMRFDGSTGIWSTRASGALDGRYYKYVLDVHVRGVGLARNVVTDPYSISLSADSGRSYITNLEAKRLKPSGWERDRAPQTVKAAPDMAIYELHVRDFSINDATVPATQRGKYLAFTQNGSAGMRHLRELARAGLTDVHLLPVYDIATIPEQGCVSPELTGGPDSDAQQAAIERIKFKDCYNWGYDPWHFNAPEGSYSSDAGDGARRIIEFRRMVMALHQAGLRVGMDVVYNHTFTGGQGQQSVLDRIVPGYYHRLNAKGEIERSTCCDNTATEHRMMARLMIDSAELWARHYKIDSFRFDLMGHHPRAAMEALQQRVNHAAGRTVQLIGEGWNFGEVANGARFVQASQLSLNGSGIGTFSDRARDALRGGGAGDGGGRMFSQQGYINGLHYAPNGYGQHERGALLKAADLVRVGLAGTLRGYVMQTWEGRQRELQSIPYGDQPAGYASQPGEVVNYVENHDNQTLYDVNVLRLPLSTSTAERARVQMLANAINTFSQGIAYYHAGQDILRSKSLDRNSFESGDWFNRLDWTYQTNYFGAGLPPAADNGKDYGLIKPLLANPVLRPAPADIAFARDTFRDLLRIRASTTLLRLRTADDVKQRLHFFNTGPDQVPTVLAARIDGAGYPGASFRTLVYLINVGVQPAMVRGPASMALTLHPVQASPTAADPRPAQASYDPANGQFSVPARTAVVFVERN